MEVLSWIFTESLIQRCFDVGMRTVDSKEKRAVSKFLAQMCGSSAGDVSCFEGQCECLVESIIAC